MKPLAELVQDDTAWMKDAACRGMDTALFFTPEGQRHKNHPARKICRSCPVITDCLEYALSWSGFFDHGIFADTAPEQRRKMRRLAS